MMDQLDPWALPGLKRWLADIDRLLHRGVAILAVDPSQPSGMTEAMREELSRHHWTDCDAQANSSPTVVLADMLGTDPALDALLKPKFDHDLAVVRLDGLAAEDLAAWSIFLQRFADARANALAGVSVLILDAPTALKAPKSAMLGRWRTALRRGDQIIWAEEALPVARDGLAAELAVALAVEVCAWRLDLAAKLVRANLDDLADPIGWLSRRGEALVCGNDPACPLVCLAEGRDDDVRHRIWKAQLMVFFPALELSRLEIVARHRGRLRVDDHLRRLGVQSIEEIELGSIRFQLRDCLTRPEVERLDTLSRARNKLAHRRPVEPRDALELLRF